MLNILQIGWCISGGQSNIYETCTNELEKEDFLVLYHRLTSTHKE